MQDLVDNGLSTTSLSAVAAPGASHVSDSPGEDAHHHIVDELLTERAVTLRKFPVLWKFLTQGCQRLFKYQEAVAWANRLARRDGREALKEFADYLDIDVRVKGLEHVPKSGRLMIIANHPTGMVDGLAVRTAIAGIRPDLFFFSNRDLVRLVPKMSEFVIPVEWLRWRRTRASMRETLEAARVAFTSEAAIVMFPAGGIARGSLFGLKELEWLDATLKLMHRHECPLLPVHIRASNSLLYYLFEVIHPELRDLLRFREIMAKRRRRFVVTIGPPIAPEAISGDSVTAIAALQNYVVRGLPRGASWPAG
jgi:putative hemolysin